MRCLLLAADRWVDQNCLHYCALYEKRVELPFLPFIGMEFQESDSSLKVSSVVWDFSDEELVVYLECDSDGNFVLTKETLARCIAAWKSDGWGCDDAEGYIARMPE